MSEHPLPVDAPGEYAQGLLSRLGNRNPIEVLEGLGAAVRELFGNPTAPVTKHVWPLEHPVVAAVLFTMALLAIAVPGAVRRYRARSAD